MEHVKWCVLSHRLYRYQYNTLPWWRHQMEQFPRYWPFVRGIHRSPVNSPHKGQWRGALIFSLICARIDGWVNNRKAGDLRRHVVHFDVIVMQSSSQMPISVLLHQTTPGVGHWNETFYTDVFSCQISILWFRTTSRFPHCHNQRHD